MKDIWIIKDIWTVATLLCIKQKRQRRARAATRHGLLMTCNRSRTIPTTKAQSMDQFVCNERTCVFFFSQHQYQDWAKKNPPLPLFCQGRMAGVPVEYFYTWECHHPILSFFLSKLFFYNPALSLSFSNCLVFITNLPKLSLEVGASSEWMHALFGFGNINAPIVLFYVWRTNLLVS